MIFKIYQKQTFQKLRHIFDKKMVRTYYLTKAIIEPRKLSSLTSIFLKTLNTGKYINEFIRKSLLPKDPTVGYQVSDDRLF